jgi:hypothetical protein
VSAPSRPAMIEVPRMARVKVMMVMRVGSKHNPLELTVVPLLFLVVILFGVDVP